MDEPWGLHLKRNKSKKTNTIQSKKYSQKKDFILRDISQKRQILYSQKNTVKKRQILYNFTYMNQNHKDIK